MTQLLEEAIERLRQLPEPMQDTAARAVINQLEEAVDDRDSADVVFQERLTLRPTI